ncbi:alpha/beta hydrolase [Gelidibacter salicanalis]|uniref:Alpha/beta hydrolase n=1 Tax=Gelidibacter salicanalis TaxID=291193 RepID=A0A934KH42_9FLAO|nr:alpha/beta hydrolase [Gelidibacter salicanalis]MBJ7879426.1 alpha/beta hydrolase [Gelidibacter salicanalis]
MKNLLFLFSFISALTFGQETKYAETDLNISKWIDGSLVVPNTGADQLVIIIAGSGPTDRNGNQNFLKTNNLKKLAQELALNGIASFRYDKRIVKQIKMKAVNPNIKFDDFVSDAITVVNYFKTQQEFKHLYIIGHSQGSLIGMLAAQEGVDGFISLAGAGQSIDAVIVEQVQKTAPMFTEDTKRAFEVLKSGRTTTDYPPALASIFDSSVQEFMMSWMRYDPAVVIKSLDIPILLINGTKDLQVSTAEAELLHNASKQAELKLIDHMNHVLFIITGDDQENAKSYNDPNGKIAEALVTSIVDFIKN